MAVWVAQKASLYSLVATGMCPQRLRAEKGTVLVTELTWQDIERDLESLDAEIIRDLNTLREQERLVVADPPQGSGLNLYRQFDGQVSLRLCPLLALLDTHHGTLLTDCVPVIRVLEHLRTYPYTTGVTVARRWLADKPEDEDDLQARFVERAGLAPKVGRFRVETRLWSRVQQRGSMLIQGTG